MLKTDLLTITVLRQQKEWIMHQINNRFNKPTDRQ